MDYIKPSELVANIADAGAHKTNLSIRDILIKGILSGAFLGYATTLAYTATVQTKLGVVGAFVFPVGFVFILLLGLELVTGSFAMVPIAVLRKKTTVPKMAYNLFWAFIGNLIGSIFYGILFLIAATKFGHVESDVVQKIIEVAQSKTLDYKHLGGLGIVVAFVKAILCNWMVTLGAVMAFTSSSTIGKIAAMWLPVFLFFAHGFEHAVVNMFVIPTAIFAGADISFSDWWLWNQIPVTIGNFLSGFLLTGLTLHIITKKKEKSPNVIIAQREKIAE